MVLEILSFQWHILRFVSCHLSGEVLRGSFLLFSPDLCRHLSLSSVADEALRQVQAQDILITSTYDIPTQDKTLSLLQRQSVY